MFNFQRYFLIRYIINNEENTGLLTKDETSETTEQNFYYLFSFFKFLICKLVSFTANSLYKPL